MSFHPMAVSSPPTNTVQLGAVVTAMAVKVVVSSLWKSEMNSTSTAQ